MTGKTGPAVHWNLLVLNTDQGRSTGRDGVACRQYLDPIEPPQIPRYRYNQVCGALIGCRRITCAGDSVTGKPQPATAYRQWS